MKKQLFPFLLFLLLPAFMFAQSYPSQEQDAYYKQRRKTSHLYYFKKVSRRTIRNYQNPFFEFRKIDDYTPYVKNDNQPYFSKYLELTFKPGSSIIDKVDERQVIRHEKKENVEAVVYESGWYENYSHGEPGVWVAYSEDYGENWEYYYTGIVQKQPLYIKGESKHPLINEQGDLQVEACLLRQMKPFMHPGPEPDFQLVKDGLLLIIDLKTLRKDTDEDGLTDIVEAKFFTDPNNRDTDGDGIPDNQDANPRCALPRTEKASAFETIINGDKRIIFRAFIEAEDGSRRDTILRGEIIPFSENPEVQFAKEDTPTVMLVTDDPDLKAIQPHNYRIIVLSEQEFLKNKKYNDKLDELFMTPMFKVDDEEDTYLIKYSQGTGGNSFLIKRTKDGWWIEIIGGWIS